MGRTLAGMAPRRIGLGLLAGALLAVGAVAWRARTPSPPSDAESPGATAHAPPAPGPPVLRGLDPAPAGARAGPPGEQPGDPSAPATLIVSVHGREGGERLEGVRVLVTPSGQEPRTALTDAEGQAVFRGLAPGAATWSTTSERFEATGLDAATLPPGGVVRVRVALRAGGRASGRVLDAATGQPIAGAEVVARSGGRTAGRTDVGGPPRLAATRTDERGLFVLTGLRLGFLVTLAASADGYADAEESLLILRSDPERHVEVDLTLERGGSLTFRVVGPDGQLAPGSEVCLYAEADRPADGLVERALRGWSRWSATTDASGIALLPGLPLNTELFAVAFAEGHAPSLASATLLAAAGPRGAAEALRLRRPAHVVLQLVLPDGRTVAMPLIGSGEEGAPRRYRISRGMLAGERADGWDLSGAQEPGVHRLLLIVEGCQQREVTLDLQEGEHARPVVPLEPSASLEVEVVAQDDVPLDAVTLTVTPTGRPSEVLARLEEVALAGIRVLDLPPGPLQLTATDALGRSASLDGVQAPARGLRLVLAPAVTVVASLAPTAGEALPAGALVEAWREGRRVWRQSVPLLKGVATWKQAAGPVHVWIVPPGHRPLRLELSGEPGEGLRVGPLALQPPLALDLRVVNRAGRTLPGARVSLEPWVLGALDLPHGEDRLEGLPADPFLLHVRAPGHLGLSVPVDLGGAPRDRLEVALPQGAELAGRIRTAAGGLALGASLRFEPLHADPEAPVVARQTVDRSGEYVERLAAGRYRLHVTYRGREQAVAEVTLAEAEVRRLDLSLR